MNMRQIGSFTVTASGGRVAIDKRCMQADMPDAASAELLRDLVAEAMAIAHQAGYDVGHEAGRRAGLQEGGIVLASLKPPEPVDAASPPAHRPAVDTDDNRPPQGLEGDLH